jgi:hypothetical protein
MAVDLMLDEVVASGNPDDLPKATVAQFRAAYQAAATREDNGLQAIVACYLRLKESSVVRSPYLENQRRLGALLSWLREHGHSEPSALTKARMSDYVEDRVRDPSAALGTQRKHFKILHAFGSYLDTKQLVHVNPFTGLAKLPRISQKSASKGSAKKRPLTPVRSPRCSRGSPAVIHCCLSSFLAPSRGRGSPSCATSLTAMSSIGGTIWSSSSRATSRTTQLGARCQFTASSGHTSRTSPGPRRSGVETSS